ncbi:centromere protein O [Hemicordylus capensis]|uniref:centromere protein O n=1 Tax=Hemicordylus capensis TaxID=884348 RepID=UPI002302FC93|nr:centromere protein O [Hemicordylus capensis]XP_053105278.1 centromere protein O [Hemicordylus capensis]
MEGPPASSRQGVLSHLENLEAHAHKAGLKQGETREHQENAVRLKMRIQELRCQRDELRAKLNMCRSQLARSKNTTKSGPQTSQATETSKQALLEWKMENVKGLLRVFHLTGLSGKLTKQGACLCISTAFEGTYLDSYYLDLLLQQPVRIQHHSVPAFIPLEQIAQKYLQADIKRFCSVLSDHLNAFAGRKFQADQLQEGFAAFLEGPLQGNSLYNLLEFNYSLEGEGRTFLFTAKLVYGDPVRILPTEATVTCKETDDAPAAVSEIAAAHMAFFREKPLHEAFSSIIDLTANLSQAVSLASQPPPSL